MGHPWGSPTGEKRRGGGTSGPGKSCSERGGKGCTPRNAATLETLGADPVRDTDDGEPKAVNLTASEKGIKEPQQDENSLK